jgi:hypothetical protein
MRGIVRHLCPMSMLNRSDGCGTCRLQCMIAAKLLLMYHEEPAMTQPSKHGRSLKMARAISRRKYKASQKRKNAAKYAARTGARPAP